MTSDVTADFTRAAKALNEAGDREIRKAVYRGFRDAAKPLGEAMVESGAAAMPKRGGLSTRVAGSKVGIRNATTGNNPRVVIALRSAQGYDLKAMDRGQLRHPVFARAGQPRRWVRQSVPANSFARAFEAGAPAVRARIIRELDAVMTDVAKKGSS